jgi:hypothetical protein
MSPEIAVGSERGFFQAEVIILSRVQNRPEKMRDAGQREAARLPTCGGRNFGRRSENDAARKRIM